MNHEERRERKARGFCETWQQKRGGGRRGIVEILEQSHD